MRKLGKFKSIYKFFILGIIFEIISCQYNKRVEVKSKTLFNSYITNKIDFLMVIGDTSGTHVRLHQELSYPKLKTFVSALKKTKANIQIGVLSPNMRDSFHQGKLTLDGQKILKINEMAEEKIVLLLGHYMNRGYIGPVAQMTFEVIKQALSPERLINENKGFLRPKSLLAIMIVNYRDDCSHRYNTSDSQLYYMQCYLPRSAIYENKNGIMNDLYPISDYIQFLRNFRNHRIMVTGIIGDPNSNSKTISTPCVKAGKACLIPKQNKTCMYRSSSTLACGGCEGREGRAYPGYRYYQVIRSISGEGYWFSICQKDPQKSEFLQALLAITSLINEHLHHIVLKTPIKQLRKIKVSFIKENNSKITVHHSKKTTSSCKIDTDCKKNYICGPNNFCHGDGWVYFPTQGRFQPKIKISGRYRAMITDTIRILVQTSE